MSLNNKNSITPSPEQKSILNCIAQGQNIVADCVAGSGKTTSCILIAETFPEKRILLATFSSRLKGDGREKVKTHNLNNLKVHSYHSICHSYYNVTGHTDIDISQVIETNMPLKRIPDQYDLLVLDETQDMKPLHYFFIKKYIQDIGNVTQKLILGDKFQAVFKFLGSDIRFITHCNQLWNCIFTKQTLSVSYRVTLQNALFINELMLGNTRIIPAKIGSPVNYIICDPDTITKKLADHIALEIEKGYLTPEDVFVLAYSLKTRLGRDKPIKSLERELVRRGIPVFYPSSDEQELKDETCKGKVTFSTFHRSKGLERKLVIIFGFDNSYYTYYDKEADPTICPELLYVAATRATSQLILLHSTKFTALPFIISGIDGIKSKDYVHFVQLDPLDQYSDRDNLKDKNIQVSVTDLVKFLKPIYTDKLTIYVDYLFDTISKSHIEVQFPSIVNAEEVNDINIMVVISMFEARNKEQSTIEKYVRREGKNYIKNNPDIEEHYTSLPDKISSVSDYIKLCLLYVTISGRVHNRIKQIKNYDWLSMDNINNCHNIMEEHLKSDVEYERYIERQFLNHPITGMY